MKLVKKTLSPYKGKVFDLSVENKNSYNIEGIPVHNSGAGSLVCYATGITQVDPVKHGLLFERFLSKKKAGLPDIDCLKSSTLVETPGGYKSLFDILPGDIVVGLNGKQEEVLYTNCRISTAADIIFEVFVQINDTIGCIVATSKHRLFDEQNKEIFVDDLKNGTVIGSNCGNAFIIEKRRVYETIELVDIVTTSSKSFNIVPYDTIKKESKLISLHTYNK